MDTIIDSLEPGRAYRVSYVREDADGGLAPGRGEYAYGGRDLLGCLTFTPAGGGPAFRLLADELMEVQPS